SRRGPGLAPRGGRPDRGAEGVPDPARLGHRRRRPRDQHEPWVQGGPGTSRSQHARGHRRRPQVGGDGAHRKGGGRQRAAVRDDVHGDGQGDRRQGAPGGRRRGGRLPGRDRRDQGAGQGRGGRQDDDRRPGARLRSPAGGGSLGRGGRRSDRSGRGRRGPRDGSDDPARGSQGEGQLPGGAECRPPGSRCDVVAPPARRRRRSLGQLREKEERGMAKYVAAIDQGTTSTRCMIFDHGGQVVAVDQHEHEQIYPQPGWVEHDPKEIWYRTQQVVDGALKKGGVDVSDIAAVGITNQRETTVVWDRNTGEPVYNAIVWQDTRTDKIIDELGKDGGQDRFRDKTGLPLATYFSGPKIRW